MTLQCIGACQTAYDVSAIAVNERGIPGLVHAYDAHIIVIAVLVPVVS